MLRDGSFKHRSCWPAFDSADGFDCAADDDEDDDDDDYDDDYDDNNASAGPF